MKARVAIVGAGPAGVTIAYQLALHRIEVDIYEKSDGDGHKTMSISGTSVGYRWDMGTCFTNASYTHLRHFMKKNGIEELNDGISYVDNQDTLISTQKTLVPNFWTGLKLVWAYIKFIGYSTSFFIQFMTGNIDWEAYSIPISEWLKKKNLEIIKEILLFAQTGQGYGFLDELPTYYVMIWLRPLTILANLSPFHQDTKIIPTGYQTLWDTMMSRPEIRTYYNSQVESIDRKTGTLKVNGDVKQYDSIILAAPLIENTHLIDLEKEEKEAIDSIQWDTKFTVVLCEADEIKDIPEDTCRIYIRETLEKRSPHKIAAYRIDRMHYFSEKPAAAAYFHSPIDSTEEDFEEMKRIVLATPWMTNPKIVEARQWNYLPLMKPENLAKGDLAKLWRMNGKDKLYVTGNCLSFESVDNIYDFNYRLTTKILDDLGLLTWKNKVKRNFWDKVWHRW